MRFLCLDSANHLSLASLDYNSSPLELKVVSPSFLAFNTFVYEATSFTLPHSEMVAVSSMNNPIKFFSVS